MSNVNAFSMNYQQLDIQTTDEYIIPQDGSWCVGLSCRSESDGYDAIALELSEPLVIGTEYELTYYTYYNGASSGSADLRIGTSLVNNDFGNEIDLVILDLIMPVIDGGKTFDRIREIHPGMLVILASGYAINDQANEIMRKGCNGFIQKPFNIYELSSQVRKMLDGGPQLN